MPTFADRLLSLLPDLYRVADTSGDLRALLAIIGPTLDELHARIAGLPDLASVERCPAEFLPYLAGLVGAAYDPTADAGPQRQAIREAVERYRRLGALSVLQRDLADAGWQGEIIESHRRVLRLGTHARLGRQALPGPRYNRGIYGVTGVGEADVTLHAILDHHRPAGTRRWTEE
jgi:phage tail-like protein